MPSAYEYIVSKQIQWAQNRGLPLIGDPTDQVKALPVGKVSAA